MLLSPPAREMVLKSTKDLSLEIAAKVPETDIFTLSPYTASASYRY
jgi:hypothetical protein